ncbi:DUF971 domain-containing protein [Pseudomonas sp. KU43P]|uniref:DUF971 domain-containing protein n=1 Tax=Pseudomonas sp. KU43P TaxID=2487887 RepID=UPI0012A81305|nr:gamma-butyrobetaine hydroxylase-like domain-containing protein [Pseudomonas sp. KU43P]BBH48604.1 hypothetical protein KU43P_50810 [Pseudomonas sp. KU43P]
MDVPAAISHLRSLGTLQLQWAERLQRLSYARLRSACPCSRCKAAALEGRINLVPDDVRIERIVPQGYGLQLVFSDGHDRGIYPWCYLRELG